MLLGAAMAAFAQQPQKPQQLQIQIAPSAQGAPPVAAPAAAETPPREKPGLVEEFGQLLKDSASGLTSVLPSPRKAMEGLNSGTKDAADRLKQMAPSGQSMVGGRAMCPAAANGAPDCKVAADQLCKQQGYKEGSSVDIESAQKCSAKAYFSGGDACQTENFVTRAVCQ